MLTASEVGLKKHRYLPRAPASLSRMGCITSGKNVANRKSSFKASPLGVAIGSQQPLVLYQALRDRLAARVEPHRRLSSGLGCRKRRYTHDRYVPKQTKGTVLSALPSTVPATTALTTKRLGSSCTAHEHVAGMAPLSKVPGHSSLLLLLPTFARKPDEAQQRDLVLGHQLLHRHKAARYNAFRACHLCVPMSGR